MSETIDAEYPTGESPMSDASVFDRCWVLTEDELLHLMWRCHGGENPDVVLVELHARHDGRRSHSPGRAASRPHRATRHVQRHRQQRQHHQHR